MGSALAVALGVAERCPHRRVVAIMGDGETLMGANSLWSLAGIRPANLLAAILADGYYSITGGQPLGTPSEFARVAETLGLAAVVVSTEAEIAERAAEITLPALIEIRIDDRSWPGPSPFVDPPVVRWRFEGAVRGDGVVA